MTASSDPVKMLLLRDGELRTIFLRNFSFDCSIGIHPFETAKPQRVTVSIELFLRPAAPARSDRIDEVLDYDFLRERILALVRGRHFNLQETLVHEIAAVCLEPEQVAGARITTEKPDVYPDCDAVGLELIRLKEPPDDARR